MARNAKTTARRPASKGGFESSPDCPRLVPTGDGRWTYVRNADGRTVHVRVGSEAYVAAVGGLVEVLGDRVSAEVAAQAAAYPEVPWALPVAASVGSDGGTDEQ